MRSNYLKATLLKAVLVTTVLLLGAAVAVAQQQINLTAAATTLTLPDGSVVPMWGYSCGALATGVTSTATCAALNPNAGTGWSPVLITIPTGATGGLQINLTNSLSFTTSTGAVNTVPTSLVIVGQIGGGLGTPSTVASPTHASLSTTWPVANTPGVVFNPPAQGPRVQSYGTEVAAGATAVSLTWSNLRPGTYLLESGTHPSIQVPMGLYGILVVTTVPSGATAGTAYPAVAGPPALNAVNYNAEVPIELSEIDPVQNSTVQAAVTTTGFSETMVWSGQPGGCGNPSSATYHQCYPPAVNYTPLYYLINGVAFDKTHSANSVFAATAGTSAGTPVTTGISGTVLVRLVNAGLRMHVPQLLGTQTAGFNGSGTPNSTVYGFQIIAEDGNVLPGAFKVQNDVFMAASKTFDVLINVPAAGSTAIPIYDRELSLSGNAINRDSGMLAYIGVNGSTISSGIGALTAPIARDDTYPSLVPCAATPCPPFSVTDPSKGVLANDTNVFGAQLLTNPASGTVTLNSNGTFSYVASAAGPAVADSFTYCANGSVTAGVCSSGITATVHLNTATLEAGSGITCGSFSATATIATYLAVKTPGLLGVCTDGAGYKLTLTSTSISGIAGPGTLTMLPDASGGFTATASAPGTYTFSFTPQNSQGTPAATPGTATLTFPTGSGLTVTVLDGYDKKTTISDYRWVIEEDRTFYIDPACTQNPPPAGCPTATAGIVPTLGVNFHTSYMPYVAQGCTGPLSCEGGQTAYNPATGTHDAVVCDIGNGVCRPDTTGNGFTTVLPGAVALDPTKRYYISVFPGDAAQPFIAGYAGPPVCTANASNQSVPTTTCGHGMGGAPIAAGQTAVTVLTQPSPYPPGKLSVFVFEDDFPLNGEQDGGGGIDVLSPNEPGLGGFQIHLWDAMGGAGDFTGQMTYDMFNQPLTNSLAGTIDPTTGLDACPLGTSIANETTGASNGTQGTAGITGMIVTCPKYESDGKTLSPLAGQAVIDNLMPGRWGLIATPGADRIARGEEWLQTNTLDGQKAHDVFTRIGEPAYFQEFGPAGYHVSIGFANPAIINARHAGVCNGTDANITGKNCGNTVIGRVTGERLSRTPDERLYSSGSHDTFYWTQCYVSFGDPDGEDFAFTKCKDDGTFTLTGLPDGDWRITVFDQWNDLLVDGLSTPIGLTGGASNSVTNIGDIATTQWQTNMYTRTFVDDNRDGVSQAAENGIPFANVAVRLRDGSLENLLVTDFTGTANFNETFPLFSWYTVETDTTRYKNTGTHVVYDVGGPADGSTSCGTSTTNVGYPPCGNSTIAHLLANTAEVVSVPTNLRVPGSVYCVDADCTAKSIQNGPSSSDPPSVCTTATTAPFATSCSTTLSSGRIDNPWLGGVEGWQGFPGQNSFIEFGKAPYFEGENGGIKGHVIYASTRPFDDPQMLVQTQWEPLVPNVTINLYQEGFAADGVTSTLKLVDTTVTSSWDKWAQGFHLAADGVTMIPNMNCPGQGASTGPIPDLFFFSLYNQPQYLDFYNSQHGGGAYTPLPNNAQFKCYDGMHDWNQVQPAPYDGMYQFPSVTSLDPTTGRPNGTNCKICIPDPVPASGTDADPLRSGLPMLPPGKYVVEVVLPPGFELVKEEDKNILIGDNFIAPVTQEFGGLGNIFILPDQASVATGWAGSGYNANNAQNPTQSLGAIPENGIVPAFVPEPIWPCVGEARIVPDYISLFPQSTQVAPFAGATRNLCDRKEVTLSDQAGAIAKFYIYTSTHIASKFMGGITDDYTSEFDPFSPTFGEKFSPPDLPVSVKDWAGNEISRVYADHWGQYNGLTYSTWEVNPPNPTGYSPTMMVMCMNDPGPINSGGKIITDPLFAYGYSQFCYELPFMPGTTDYLDTPVVPTSAFAGAGYNNVDCSYPDATPAVAEVDGDQVGPWLSTAPGSALKLTITALGDQAVQNYAYSGPSATTAPYNMKTVTHHYGFGTQCTSPTAGNATCNTLSSVTIGGAAATIVSWSDSQIVVTAPALGGAAGVPLCNIQQQAAYTPGLTAAERKTYCGELVITAGNGKQSIDSVTVTIGGKAPTHISASQSIQPAIDAAAPGDLIMIDPTCNTAAGAVTCTTGGVAGVTYTTAAHNELLLMWKPVRLQGVGAATSIINANTHPAGKLDAWRQEVNCLFGLALNGQPVTGSNPFDPTGTSSCPGAGWNYFTPTTNNPQVDRLPLEATLGWDANLNGNLAELLQEPSLMGALEGAGITVLSKGVFFPSNPFDPTLLAGFPTGTVLLTGANTGAYCNSTTASTSTSNFWCNPSSIDGLGITDASQGGGGIFVHGWGHNIQIANNRIYDNAGTLSGGINIGQGEFPGGYVQGSTTNAAPGSCETSNVPNSQLPYCHNMHVNVHNNYVSLNSSTGDELFSATPAGAGGVSFCTGSDYYMFNYNWVCGNLSSGDGGGLGHLGFSKNGDIEHNTIIFNQSLNPTIPANGGGIVIMGTPDADPTCGATTDADCVPTPGSIGPSDGMGPGLVINANLIQGNAAEAGSGGGIRFQNVNGSEVVAFPTRPQQWYHAVVQNNIIVDNIAGWDGAGISLQDALNVDIINNTIASNSTTASAGILFTTIGAPLASDTSGTNCMITATTSCPQPAGLVSTQNSAVLMANLPSSVHCPAGHYAPGTSANNGACRYVSYPLLYNDLFWQNSAYYIGVGALSTQYQQNVVSLFNAFTSTQAPTQPQADATAPNGNGSIISGGTGACLTATYWDLGIRGDTSQAGGNLLPGGAPANIRLDPEASFITAGYPGSGGSLGVNSNANPQFVSQYCDGARTPPEFGASGFAVPPGISDATVPNPVFNLTPVATVDEGNNWINLRWGPLSLTNPTVTGADGNYGGGAPLGNYAPATGSPAIGYITPVSAPTPYAAAPFADFFGNPRKTVADPNVTVGAIEVGAGPATADLAVTKTDGVTSVVPRETLTYTIVVTNNGPSPVAGGALTDTLPGSTLFTVSSWTCTPSAGSTCTATGAGNTTRGGVVNLANGGTATYTLRGTVAAGAAIGASLTNTVTVAVPAGTTDPNLANNTATDTDTVVSALMPNPVNFGNQTRLTTSAPMTVTFTNYSTAAVTLRSTGAGAVTITGTNAGNFAIAPGTTCTNGAVIAANGGTCVIHVTFRPTADGARNGTLNLFLQGGVGAFATDPLTGTGIN
jgi:uncharacterized repeat protein (TIGR01451 family)